MQNDLDSISETYNFLCSQLVVPTQKEIYEYSSIPLNYAEYQTHLEKFILMNRLKILDSLVIRTDEDVKNRSDYEMQTRNINKKLSKKLEGVSGCSCLIISNLNLKPIIVVVGSKLNEKYLKFKIHRKIRGLSNVDILFISKISDIDLGDNFFLAYLRGKVSINLEKTYQNILGYYLSKKAERFPNLPLDLLNGVRLNSRYEIAYNPTRFQRLINKLMH